MSFARVWPQHSPKFPSIWSKENLSSYMIQSWHGVKIISLVKGCAAFSNSETEKLMSWSSYMKLQNQEVRAHHIFLVMGRVSPLNLLPLLHFKFLNDPSTIFNLFFHHMREPSSWHIWGTYIKSQCISEWINKWILFVTSIYKRQWLNT